mmetsp:Transcript_74686/g.148444  ORF Transcript_74686/g.148444 Transcript_74686/m.148444 type:complete len:210 (-) Transcript_74686:109-738(-)
MLPVLGGHASAEQVVSERAAHVVVGLATEHVVTHVVLIDIPAISTLEDPVGEALAPRNFRPEAEPQRHRREAMHGGVNGVPYDSVKKHRWQQDGERLLWRPPHEQVGWQHARQHLDCHDERRRPVEGCATVHICIQCLRHRVCPPTLVVLEAHVVVRLSVVLDVAVAWHLAAGCRLTSELGVDILEFIEIVGTVELEVLEIAMRHILIQ